MWSDGWIPSMSRSSSLPMSTGVLFLLELCWLSSAGECCMCSCSSVLLSVSVVGRGDWQNRGIARGQMEKKKEKKKSFDLEKQWAGRSLTIPCNLPSGTPASARQSLMTPALQLLARRRWYDTDLTFSCSIKPPKKTNINSPGCKDKVSTDAFSSPLLSVFPLTSSVWFCSLTS